MVGQDSCVALQNGMKSILNVNLCKYARKRRREKRRKKKINKLKKDTACVVQLWPAGTAHSLKLAVVEHETTTHS